MKHLTVRNVPYDVARALEKERRRGGKSLNQTVLDVLERGLGVSRTGERQSNGLRRLAGNWSRNQLEEFEAATAAFEKVDEDLWR